MWCSGWMETGLTVSVGDPLIRLLSYMLFQGQTKMGDITSQIYDITMERPIKKSDFI